jgi:hypothetical protein
MLNRAAFRDIVQRLKQGEQDPDAGYFSWELLHHLHSPLTLFENPFNEVSCSYVLPSACRITHVGQAGTQVFWGMRRVGRKNAPILIVKTLSLNLGFYEIRSVGDPIQPSFDQRPLTLGTLGLEIGHLVEKAALMLITGEDRSDGCYDPWTTVRAHHQDRLGVQPSTDQLSEQGLPRFVFVPVTLGEAKMLAFFLLGDPYRTRGSLPAKVVHTQFEVDSVNEPMSGLVGGGPAQSPDGRLLDALVHPAYLWKIHISAPEQMGDLPDLACGHPSDKPRYQEKTMRIAKRRAKEQRPVFKDKCGRRTGIEATISEYDRTTGVKRVRVRSFPAVRYCATLKAIGVNLFRATAVQNVLRGQGEAPQPRDSLLHRVILILIERVGLVWEKVKRLASPLSSHWRPDQLCMAP